MQAVVEEKENRTMEVLMTSVSSTQLMSGKIIGIIGVGLTQLLAWIGFATLAVLAGRYYFPFLEAIHISFSSVGLLVITLLPAFVMVAALMVAVGATVTDAREGQQIASLFTFPVVIPYWFTYQLMSNPNGPLAVGLSLFPLTAPVALTMRVGFTYIPMWQVGVTTGILVVSALASLWLAGRAFRLGMLQYGQRLSWRQLSGRGK
jgi:ABC-2 type transport system permease protein